ncbi:unnamed protein product, partial [Meganyctiphanes norvegica]
MMGGGLLGILSICSLLLPNFAIYLDGVCLIRQKYESNQDGTQTHIRAWVNGTDQLSSVIKITLEFDPKGYPETFDIIEIWKDQIELRRVRKNDNTDPLKLPIIHPLTPGWMEMTLVSGEEFQLNFTKMQNGSYTYKGERERLRKIRVEGSYITFNCLNDIIYWRIEHFPKIIPLELNIYNNFSIFSRKEYIPSIKIGEKNLQLGFNGGIMNDISSLKENLQVPLSGHKEYYFNIGCINEICEVW